MHALLDFEVAIGRDAYGGVLHWKAPGCVFVTANCTQEAFIKLGGYMYGVALNCIEEIALLKVEAKQMRSDGSVLITEDDLMLLGKL
jgi:hypothetical protein